MLYKLPLLLALLIQGCAHTEKYLRPEHTFSNLLLSQYKTASGSRAIVPDQLTEVCADFASTHSPIIWIPLVGPAFDLSMTAHGSSNSGDNFIIFLPFIGPAISYAATGSKTCTYKTVVLEDKAVPESRLNVEQVRYIRSLANANCAVFLNRLYGNLSGLGFGKDAAGDLAEAASAGIAFASPLGTSIVTAANLVAGKGLDNLEKNFLSGQMYPAIVATIAQLRAEHDPLKQLFPTEDDRQSASLAQAMDAFGVYDQQCAIERAVQILNAKQVMAAEKPENQAQTPAKNDQPK